MSKLTGKLRAEPKVKPFISKEEYNEYYTILKEAQKAATENHVYWDLEGAENANHIRKAFLLIATQEGIPVTIRRERGSQSLAFSFRGASKATPARMSANESQKRILDALASESRPLQKSEIISATGISPSTWNIRIKELIADGKVVREGDRRDTKYCLPR